MAIRTGNFSGNPNPECNNGDTFESCNLIQAVADTPICGGKTGLTFINCNLINCTVPEDADVIQCNVCKKDMCVHIHPNLGLPAEPVECRHWIGADINDDGDLINQYEDKKL